MNLFLNSASRKTTFAAVTLMAALAFTGCGPSMPEIVQVTGTITINGKPYEHVEVKFYPLREGMDGNTVAMGVTDKEGKYTLTLPGKDDPGAYACACKVTISEGPVPDEIRRSRDQLAAAEWVARLKFRPLPVKYARMVDTPLEANISPEETNFDFDLSN